MYHLPYCQALSKNTQCFGMKKIQTRKGNGAPLPLSGQLLFAATLSAGR